MTALTYDTARPYIAAYILIKKNDKYVFVKRAHTKWRNGFYSLPAGKVEKNESYVQAAVREAKEEVGVDIAAQDLQHVLTGHRDEDGNSWVDVFFLAHSWQGEPHNAEPDVHSEIAWFSLDKLPDKTIPSLRSMLEQFRAGKTYAEFGW